MYCPSSRPYPRLLFSPLFVGHQYSRKNLHSLHSLLGHVMRIQLRLEFWRFLKSLLRWRRRTVETLCILRLRPTIRRFPSHPTQLFSSPCAKIKILCTHAILTVCPPSLYHHIIMSRWALRLFLPPYSPHIIADSSITICTISRWLSVLLCPVIIPRPPALVVPCMYA